MNHGEIGKLDFYLTFIDCREEANCPTSFFLWLYYNVYWTLGDSLEYICGK